MGKHRGWGFESIFEDAPDDAREFLKSGVPRHSEHVLEAFNSRHGGRYLGEGASKPATEASKKKLSGGSKKRKELQRE